MRIRLRTVATRLMIFTVLFILVSASMSKVSYSQGSSVAVDVYTQYPAPYGGQGPNMPSDAFGPEDIVILYALVTSSGSPLNDTLVGFDVKIPNGSQFGISAATNASGIATVNFTISTPPVNVSESDIFGTWLVTAGVLYQGETYQDMLSFKVDWVVKLLTVQTIAENFTYQDQFGRGGDMGLEITMRSIGMTLRNATIDILIEDTLGVPVNSSEIQNFAVQPNEKIVFLYCKATLPKFAYVGTATVLVSAFKTLANQTLIPYCPTISTTFEITGQTPVEINYHDPGIVAVLPSAKTIEVGQGLTLQTIVRNKGTVTQSFTVSTYFDNILLGTSQIVDLPPYSMATFQFTVNVSLLTVGTHTISAYIPPVPQQADFTDINFSDTINVIPVTPALINDIGITGLTLSNNSVFIGQTVEIDVTILNNGNQVETFNVSTYYNSSLIQTLQVDALAPLSQILMTFSWNTSLVEPGMYQISASAPLPGDPTPWDNTLVDGTVQVKAVVPPPIFPTPELLVFVVIVGLAVFAGLIMLFLIFFLDRPRRRKRPRPTYTVVVRPHI